MFTACCSLHAKLLQASISLLDNSCNIFVLYQITKKRFKDTTRIPTQTFKEPWAANSKKYYFNSNSKNVSATCLHLRALLNISTKSNHNRAEILVRINFSFHQLNKKLSTIVLKRRSTIFVMRSGLRSKEMTCANSFGMDSLFRNEKSSWWFCNWYLFRVDYR